MTRVSRCWLGLVLLALPLPSRADEFFEKKIRPVLVEQCYACHSAEATAKKKLKGSLSLDQRDAVLAGGDSGPALVPGKPKESLLLTTLKYDGDVRMPPKGKLPDAVIADFETWIASGAKGLPEGKGSAGKTTALTIEKGRSFWAYRPPQRAELPQVTDPAWAKEPIDRWIRAGIDARKLTPAPPADRATLIRRLSFDLTGLPPTPEEVDAFVNDKSPDAYPKLVDRLLASPAFGEQWGRHWLDIARYAESVTLRGFVFKNAWRYRDYVIDSMNRDVPFDRFICEQIAGDLLPADDLPTRQRNLIATTFLALGNTNLEEQDKKLLRMDVVDEQLDVIGKGFLAQTITCARCHDHKFDPIPTKDYYALAGILRNAKAMDHSNVSAWVEMPLPLPPDEEARYKQHEQAVAVLQAKIKTAKAQVDPKGTKSMGVLAVTDIPGIVVDDTQAKKVGDWMTSQFSGSYIGTGYIHDQNAGKGDKTLTFQPEMIPPGRYEVRLAYSPGSSRAAKVPVTIFSAEGEKAITVDLRPAPPIEGRYVSLGEYRFEKNGQCHVIVSNEGTMGHVTADAVVFVSLDRLMETKKPAIPSKATGAKTVADLEAELKALQQSGPKRPTVMTVTEEKTIEDARVHIRGNVHNQGDVVPRGFLQVTLTRPTSPIPPGQSGRKELAEWIASADNPLTARVIVNRTWHWLHGSGIVRTTDNFGATGEPPSHPELLDMLTLDFIRDGWSMKKLIRRIVLSETYQRSSEPIPALVQADPDNRLFAWSNRRRLEGEAIRDRILVASGQLDLTRGGPTFPDTLAADYGYKAPSRRRSVYLPMFRNALPEELEVFDAADPSMTTGKRNSSTVAQQALFFLNHPFPIEQSKLTAKRILAENHPSDEARLVRVYRVVLGREPSQAEQTLAAKYLKQSSDPATAWAELIHALFASADFRYLD